jgi:putative transposase
MAKYLESIFRELVKERESSIAEGHICPDHAHTLIEIPQKYSAA